MRYQHHVFAIRLYQGRYRVAGIPFGSAGKAPQEGLQEEEVKYGSFRVALPEVLMEADARAGTVRCNNAQRGAAANGMDQLYKLLRDPHVAQEESHNPMRDGVEGLGDITG